MHHSNRGSQCASQAFQDKLTAYGLTCSMSQKGNCWDNAPTASWFNRFNNKQINELLEGDRLKPEYFTRERSLSFPTALTFLLSCVQDAVQSERDQFFAHLRNRADSIRRVSAQAFYKARDKISAFVFSDLHQQLIAAAEEPLPVPRWQGLRVVAGDGTAVRLTTMKEDVRSIVTGVAFGLYLPGTELFLHFGLQEGACDERQRLFEAIEHRHRDDLLVLDRGFPCR